MRQKQEGMILVFVVVIIGIVSIMYASIYILIGIENNIYQSLEDRTKAYYIAESGLEKGVAQVRQNITTSIPLTLNPFAPEYSGEHSFEVLIEQTGPENYTIKSTGIYRNTKRFVEATVLKNSDVFEIQSWKEIN